MSAGWDEGQVALLKDLCSQKPTLSSGEIASIMKISRNAVIGKMHRLGLHKNKKKKLPFGRVAALVSTPVARFPVEMSLPVAYQEPEPWHGSGVSILDVKRGQCRAVIGSSHDPNGLAMMCGLPTIPHQPWCKDHSELFLNPPWRRR